MQCPQPTSPLSRAMPWNATRVIVDHVDGAIVVRKKQGLVAAKPIVTLYFRTASPLRIAPAATWPRDTNATDGTGVPMATSVRDHDVVFEMRPDHRLGKCLADCIEHDVFLDRVRRRAPINIGQRRFQR
jgi:hypothetical protein